MAYNVTGHAFHLQDGTEMNNTLTGNLGFVTYPSYTQLNTETTPATFYVAHPNNTLTGNVAAGSSYIGYWYRFLKNPEGPYATTNICPKYSPMLGAFDDNIAHSNGWQGLRIFPEYYPRTNPCSAADLEADGPFTQVPATFTNLLAYKNGLKVGLCS